MTTFLDAPIAIDPKGQAVNPAIEYLAWCAWGDDLANRRRFNAALVSAVYKQAGRQVPPPLPRLKREGLAGTVHKGLARIRRHAPAALLVRDRLAGRTVLAPCQHRHQDMTPAKVADNIAPNVWRDARPMLAMLLALPLDMGRLAADLTPIEALRYSPGWVPAAIRRALELSVRIEAGINPPTLLAPRPRLYCKKGAWLIIRPSAMTRFLGPPSK